LRAVSFASALARVSAKRDVPSDALMRWEWEGGAVRVDAGTAPHKPRGDVDNRDRGVEHDEPSVRDDADLDRPTLAN
jgi:hypothetical protein